MMRLLAAATALILAGCFQTGPGTYGAPEHDLVVYPLVGIVETGNEELVVRRLRTALKRDDLWNDVHRIDTQKDVLLLWAMGHVHLRVDIFLEEMRESGKLRGR
jgi:hypothetical protein